MTRVARRFPSGYHAEIRRGREDKGRDAPVFVLYTIKLVSFYFKTVVQKQLAAPHALECSAFWGCAPIQAEFALLSAFNTKAPSQISAQNI